METIKAIFADLDGTMLNGHGKLFPGLKEVIDPNAREFRFTILTGRGYPRFREAIDTNPQLDTGDMPVALEHGARIVRPDGTNAHYVPLSPQSLDAVEGYLYSQELHSASFYPEDTRGQTVHWVSNHADASSLSTSVLNKSVVTPDVPEFIDLMRTNKPCTVTCRVFEGSHQNLPGVPYYSQGKNVNFVPEKSDKGQAAGIIADIMNISFENVLAAGNDRNDIPMLKLPGLAVPVYVGVTREKAIGLYLPDSTIYVPNPKNLGKVIFERTNN